MPKNLDPIFSTSTFSNGSVSLPNDLSTLSSHGAVVGNLLVVVQGGQASGTTSPTLPTSGGPTAWTQDRFHSLASTAGRAQIFSKVAEAGDLTGFITISTTGFGSNPQRAQLRVYPGQWSAGRVYSAQDTIANGVTALSWVDPSRDCVVVSCMGYASAVASVTVTYNDASNVTPEYVSGDNHEWSDQRPYNAADTSTSFQCNTGQNTGTHVTAVVVYQVAATASFADTAAPTDTFSPNSARARSYSETAAPTATFSSSHVIGRSFSDTAAPTATFSKTMSYARPFADTAAPTDTLSQSTSHVRSFADTAAPTDTFSIQHGPTQNFADTAAPTDTFTTSTHHFRGFTDTAAPTDSFIVAGEPHVTFNETAAPTATFTTATIHARNFADTAAPTDVLSPHSTRTRTFNDTAAPIGSFSSSSGSLTVNPSTGGGTYSTGGANTGYLRSFNDTAAPTATFTRHATIYRTFNDTAAPTATFALTTSHGSGAVVTISFPDTAAPTATFRNVATFARAFADDARPSALFQIDLGITFTDVAAPTAAFAGTFVLQRFATFQIRQAPPRWTITQAPDRWAISQKRS